MTNSAKTRVLAVGLHQGYVSMFGGLDDLELYVLEEPELIAANPTLYESDCIAGILTAEYQQSDAFLSGVSSWNDTVGFDAVLPCWEYSVEAAALIADAFELPFPGMRAVACCRDKLELRVEAATFGIPQPRFTEVQSAADVAAFFEGKPIVLKPSNRRQSVGVVRVNDAGEIADAWGECTSAGDVRGVTSRGLRGRYMVEDLVDGVHVSVETLVQRGRVVWENVSTVATPNVNGRHFPVMMYVVPAAVLDEVYAEAAGSGRRLVAGFEAHDGLFHSEWLVNDSGAFLLECAARAPGVVPELVPRAYGFSLYEAYVRVLAGLQPAVVSPARCVAAVKYFDPPPGRVVAIRGLDDVLAHPSVFLCRLKVGPGDRVPSFADSWQRAGRFGVVAPTHDDLIGTIAEVEQMLEFVVSADSAVAEAAR